MRIIDSLVSMFAAAKETPAAPTGDTAWANSNLYTDARWPTYNPDDLIGRKGYNIYRQMMTDEQVKAVVHFRRNSVTGREWKLEEHPELSDDENGARIRVLNHIISRLPGSFKVRMDMIMSSMYQGFSITEKVFGEIELDGKSWVGLTNLAPKPCETFYFHIDQYGNLQKFVQKVNTRELELDINKFIHHVHNPDTHQFYGRSELREAHRSWFSKDMAIRFQNIHLERAATGFIVAKPLGNTSLIAGSPAYNSLTNVLASIRSNAAILLPANIDVEVHTFGSTDIYGKAVAQNDKGIAKALLMPNLLGLSEQGSTGSYSQSQTQMEAFLWMLNAEAKSLEETVHEQLFKQLCMLNFGDELCPRFTLNPLSQAQVDGILGRWKEMVGVKAVTPSETDEDHIRALLNFPEREEDEEEPGGGEGEEGEAELPEEPEDEVLPDETVMGKGTIQVDHHRHDHSLAFTRAIKRVDFAVIDNRSVAVVNKAATKVTEDMKAALSSIIETVKERNPLENPDMVGELRIPAKFMSRIRKTIEAGLKEAWDLGGEHGRRELEKAQGKRFAVDPLRLQGAAAQKFLESRSMTVAGDLADNMRKKVVTVVYNGIKAGWPITEIVDRIEEEVGVGVLPHISTAIRTTTFEAINEARYDLFASPEVADFVEALEFSAILDGRTTEICSHMDGRTYATTDAIWQTYEPPLHFNCRSLLVAVTSYDTWERSDDPSLLPADGFGG